MDQNENIAQKYGCTHVALIDGCSRMICGYASMEVNLRICFLSCNFKVWVIAKVLEKSLYTECY